MSSAALVYTNSTQRQGLLRRLILRGSGIKKPEPEHVPCGARMQVLCHESSAVLKQIKGAQDAENALIPHVLKSPLQAFIVLSLRARNVLARVHTCYLLSILLKLRLIV